MSTTTLQYYLDKYLAGTLDAREWISFRELLKTGDNMQQLARLMDEQYIDNPLSVPTITEEVVANVLRQINVEKRPVHFLKAAWLRYAAAILIFIIGVATYFFIHSSPSTTDIVKIDVDQPAIQDVLPGSNKAVLTLSNGKQVELDSAAFQIKDGNQFIENNSGQLNYKNSTAATKNTMTTPKGGQYKITLADGTRVWLNAASSITYPTAFTESVREVTVKGEVYFEVAPDKQKPFTVKTVTEEITVIGTSFNVNAYPDEPSSKTSLMEGSIKIAGKILKPGEAYQDGKVITTNLSQDVAWKNGYFNFENVQLAEVMRQLSRWYNLEVVYEGPIPDIRFVGEMTRNISLKSVLKILEGAGVQFTLKERRVLIVK